MSVSIRLFFIIIIVQNSSNNQMEISKIPYLLSENLFTQKIGGVFKRYPNQINNILESDGEIIRLRENPPGYMVIKVDGIYEEIRQKLYDDPRLIGWMAVTVTLSDMAATGSDPIGILLSLQLVKSSDSGWLEGLQRGINEACEAYGVFVLGSDTNFDVLFSITTMAISSIQEKVPLMRKTIMEGDLLFSTRHLGLGNAYAYSKYFDDSIQVSYRPEARLKESKVIKEFATACIDTSDGFFPAVSNLVELNHLGLKMERNFEEIIHENVKAIQKKNPLPTWIFLAGPHGEYELLFSIPSHKKEMFLEASSTINWNPVFLGVFNSGNQVQFQTDGLKIQCRPSEVANLFDEVDGNIQLYFQSLLELHQSWLK